MCVVVVGGASVPFFDPDAGDVHTWQLLSNDAHAFKVDPATGNVSTRVKLDYEYRKSYSIVLKVLYCTMTRRNVPVQYIIRAARPCAR